MARGDAQGQRLLRQLLSFGQALRDIAMNVRVSWALFRRPNARVSATAARHRADRRRLQTPATLQAQNL
jgi:hypothetical protein